MTKNERVNAMKYEIVEGDLIGQDVDVIVNAWNRNIIPWWLLLPQGVSVLSGKLWQGLRSDNLCRS